MLTSACQLKVGLYVRYPSSPLGNCHCSDGCCRCFDTWCHHSCLGRRMPRVIVQRKESGHHGVRRRCSHDQLGGGRGSRVGWHLRTPSGAAAIFPALQRIVVTGHRNRRRYCGGDVNQGVYGGLLHQHQAHHQWTRFRIFQHGFRLRHQLMWPIELQQRGSGENPLRHGRLIPHATDRLGI